MDLSAAVVQAIGTNAAFLADDECAVVMQFANMQGGILVGFSELILIALEGKQGLEE